MVGPEIKFSVVTATYNAAAVLPRLIASLRAQTDQDFEWVVADGGSTDGTLELLAAAQEYLKISIDSRPDFGIYDALNRAVKIAHGDYYLVVGADDELSVDAVEKYKAVCLKTNADFVTAEILLNGKRHGICTPSWEWLHGMSAHVSCHSVGLAIRRNLHQVYGFYSAKLPIAADHLFVLRAIHGGAVVSRQPFVAGTFNLAGTSGGDVLGTPLDCLHAQVLAGHWVWPQVMLFLLRLLRRGLRKRLLAN